MVKLWIFCAAFFCLGQRFHQVDSIFTIDQIRVPMSFPSTIRIDTPIMAWFFLEVALKVLGVGIWLGLPRIPERRPVRDAHDPHDPRHGFMALDLQQLVSYLDVLAQLDNEECLSRLVCHLQTLPESDLSFEREVVLRAIWVSASPSFNYSPFKSPRRKFVNAAYFGKVTACFRCCQLVYKSCNVETTLLLGGLDFL